MGVSVTKSNPASYLNTSVHSHIGAPGEDCYPPVSSEQTLQYLNIF